ncbi:MAG: paraslipin [Rhodospirillaceae bacterium]|nr:paraslipin [Rhodospirillaceae bacterium]
MTGTDLFLFSLVIFVIGAIVLGIKIVPQSRTYVIERFGKYTKTLPAGLHIIVPYLDRVAARVDILERQLDEFPISVITEDNVEVGLKTVVFFRVVDAAKSIYRITDIDSALETTAKSVVRSAGGKLSLDNLQSSRDSMNTEIETKLSEAAKVWGIDVTRTEVTDVLVDDKTKESQRQQLNAERERRATVAKAEGKKREVELAAEAQFFAAQKQADAIRVEADAKAYSVKVQADAEAEQTNLIASAIKAGGQPAINFELMKRQVSGLSELASSQQTKTLILPTDITKTLGSIEVLVDSFRDNKRVKGE